MKKVLFVIGNMEIGGTRTSLINLLNNLKNEKNIAIDLLIISPKGELMNEVPNYVNIKSSGVFLESFFENISVVNLCSSFIHIMISILKTIFGYNLIFKFLYKNMANNLKKENEYDAVIGFQEGISDDAASFVHGKKHYSWVHSNLDVWFNKKDYCESTFMKSDNIIFVAEATKQNFIKKFPYFRDKCIVIKNTINSEVIINKSRLDDDIKFQIDHCLQFVSIGRFNPEKAFERIIEVSNYLISSGLTNFIWYIIGDGVEKNRIEGLIKNYGLSSNVILLGAMSNPYTILSRCNCLILTSLSESQPMVILESLILKIPVITTKFDSAIEIAQGAEHTYICDNSITGLENAIANYMNDENLRFKMKESAKKFKYDCNDTILSIKNLL